MKLRFTPRATRDLVEIAEYLHTRNPRCSRSELQYCALFRIWHFFRRSVVYKMSRAFRKLVTPRYRYLVYYMIDEGAEEIVILTIQHPSRGREYRDA